MSKCRPHVWNVEPWLPLYAKARPEDHPAMECVNCGRVLAVVDTTPNMRTSIMRGIASRLFEGDEYTEVYEAVGEYFRFHLTGTRGLLMKERARNRQEETVREMVQEKSEMLRWWERRADMEGLEVHGPETRSA